MIKEVNKCPNLKITIETSKNDYTIYAKNTLDSEEEIIDTGDYKCSADVAMITDEVNRVLTKYWRKHVIPQEDIDIWDAFLYFMNDYVGSLYTYDTFEKMFPVYDLDNQDELFAMSGCNTWLECLAYIYPKYNLINIIKKFGYFDLWKEYCEEYNKPESYYVK